MTNILNIRAQCTRLIFVCCALLLSIASRGQENWGPNALPVIDIPHGETKKELSAEISVSYYSGYKSDISITPNLKLNIPLFTRWVNLEAWYSIIDFYKYSTIPGTNELLKKNWRHIAGDIYVSTNIQVLHGDWLNPFFKTENIELTQYIPSAVVRIGIKTASGGDAYYRRFIDAPGYFFDLTITEKIKFNNNWAKSLSIGGRIGFYCWQTGKTEQNDAYMYGLKGEFEAHYLHLSAEWGGYTGWQNNGDKPMTIKAKIGIPCKFGIEPYFAYQYGLRNYPYQEFRIGLKYSINIIK